MKKLTLLKVVNVLLVLAFVLVVKSLIVGEIFEDSSWRHAAHELHEVSGGLFIVLAFVHIGLNWNWIRATFFAKRSSQ